MHLTGPMLIILMRAIALFGTSMIATYILQSTALLLMPCFWLWCEGNRMD